MIATDVIEDTFRMYLLKEQSDNFEYKFVLLSADYSKNSELKITYSFIGKYYCKNRMSIKAA